MISPVRIRSYPLPTTTVDMRPSDLDRAATASARAGLSAAEEVLWARWTLAQAFDPTREPPERRPVAPVPTPQERL